MTVVCLTGQRDSANYNSSTTTSSRWLKKRFQHMNWINVRFLFKCILNSKVMENLIFQGLFNDRGTKKLLYKNLRRLDLPYCYVFRNVELPV